MIGFLAVHLHLDFFPDDWGSIIVEHDWPPLGRRGGEAGLLRLFDCTVIAILSD